MYSSECTKESNTTVPVVIPVSLGVSSQRIYTLQQLGLGNACCVNSTPPFLARAMIS